MKLMKAILTAFFNHKSFVVKFIRLYDPSPLFLSFKLKHDLFLGLSKKMNLRRKRVYLGLAR